MLQSVVMVATVVCVPLVLAEVAAAAPAAPTPMTSAVNEGVDYASEAYADRIDMNNTADFDPTPYTPSEQPNSSVAGIGLSNVSMNNGIVNLTANPGGWYDLAMTSTGALHVGRDTALHPIDTSRYTRFQVRMFSSGTTTGALFWFNCTVNMGSCQGAQPFTVFTGWRTYDVTIANQIGNLAWSGSMTGFRFYPNINGGSPNSVQIDWIRLAGSGTNVNVTIPQAAQEVWWDTDTNPNNNSNVAGAQLFATNVAMGGTAVLPSSALTPGTYYVYYVSGGQVSNYSSPITVAARPQPVVIDPDITGGDDYAATVRGDAWDFNQSTDVDFCDSCTMNVAGGLANGGPAGPNLNDPQLFPSMGSPIDAATYHKLSFRISYDGTFGLADAPGGGMVARFLWEIPDGMGGGKWTETNDIITYPSAGNTSIYPDNTRQYQTVSVDLKTNPPSAINDENSTNKHGWGGPQSPTVTRVHLDPHEDPAGRSWKVDAITIARNDRGTPKFNIRFKDNAWAPGTTAELYVDSDRAGFNGTKIANNLPVTSGENTFEWNGTDTMGNPVGAGTFWVYLKLNNSLAASTQTYATGELEMPVQPANPPGAPTNVQASAAGKIESASVSWTPPASNGGAPITNYVVTVNPGNGKVIVPFGTNSTVVQGLTGGQQYTFTVAAQNSAGIGPAGGPAGPVTPAARPGTRFHPIVPYRVLDSRTPTGNWNAKLGANETRDLVVAGTGGAGGVPANASAVVLNVTATNGSLPSFATVFPAGGVRPTPSNLNFGAGETIPNLVTAKIGNNGSVAFFNANGSVDFVADAVGYYDDGMSAVGDLFFGMTPARLLDSRSATGGWSGPLDAANDRTLVVRGGTTGVPMAATAVVMNVTVTNASSGSFVRVWPTGAAPPITSNLNFAQGQTIPNLVVVQVGSADSVSFHNQIGATDVVADVLGYYAPTAGGSFFHAMAPVRVLDDRVNVGGYSTPWGPTPPNPAREVLIAGTNGIPAGATGVVMNTTVTNPTSGSFVKVYPHGVTPPDISNVNFGPGQTIPNLVMVQLPASGSIDIANKLGTVDIIGDVAGYFAST